jgi:hypothetical protein
MKKIFLILFLIFLQLGIVSVSSGQTDKKTFTRKIMEKSGMNDQIRQIPLLYSSGLSQSKDKVPPEIFSTLERETLKALDPEKILREISKQVETSLDVKSMQGVLMWLESDLGQKITAIEKDSTTPEGMRGIEEYGALLEKKPASKKRQDLMQRFIEATNSVEMDVDIRISVTNAMLMAINSVLPKEKQTDVDVIKKEIEGLRPKIEEEARRLAIQTNLYIYRTLKDEEFQPYVEFAESQSGKRYHKVTSGAVKAAMQRVSSDFGKALGDLLKKIPRKDKKGASGKILVHLKDGKTLTWNNYTEKEDRYCTWIAGGELCINKKDVSSIGSE